MYLAWWLNYVLFCVKHHDAPISDHRMFQLAPAHNKINLKCNNAHEKDFNILFSAFSTTPTLITHNNYSYCL